MHTIFILTASDDNLVKVTYARSAGSSHPGAQRSPLNVPTRTSVVAVGVVGTTSTTSSSSSLLQAENERAVKVKRKREKANLKKFYKSESLTD